MNRRQFLQLLGLAPLVACVSRNTGETEMAIGDIFAKLANGNTLSPSEIEMMRLKMNMVEATNDVVRGWTQPGKTSPYFNFLEFGNSRGDQLPHECASFFYLDAPGQEIADSTYTTLVFETDSNPANFEHGMDRDLTNADKIYVQGMAKQSVYLVVGHVAWDLDATGHREVKIRSDSGLALIVQTQNTINANAGLSQDFVYLRQAATDDEYYFVDVWQNSGGALNVLRAQFAVARLR